MPDVKHAPIGHHYIVEASGCDPKIISSVEKVQQILVKAEKLLEPRFGQFRSANFPHKESVG